MIYYIIEPKNDKVFRFNDCRTHSSNDIFNGFPRLKKIKKDQEKA